jgi:hypothetical protein
MEVTIYSYRVYDGMTDAHVIPQRMATREFIARIDRAEILEESAKRVDERCITGEGQEILDPAKGR